MKKTSRIILTVIAAMLVASLFSAFAFAEGDTLPAPEVPAEHDAPQDSTGVKAVAAAVAVASVAAAGAVGMAVAISKCASAMSRQPEIAEKINSSMMLGLVFIETAMIYALIVAILIIFVL